MGEIPSWLIELAESADNEESDQVINQEPITLEEPQPESGFLEEPVTLMEELRSQVEVEPESVEPVVEDSPEGEPRKQISLAGMVPWQLAVVSVLLFLDILVIGLLFLAMLGNISF